MHECPLMEPLSLRGSLDTNKQRQMQEVTFAVIDTFLLSYDLKFENCITIGVSRAEYYQIPADIGNFRGL